MLADGKREINSAGLGELERLFESTSQVEIYDLLDFNYEMEKAYQSRGDFQEQRALFTEKILWNHPPNSDVVKRFFNQLNSYYAERWIFKNTQAELSTANMMELNGIVLFRQGKALGFREKQIGFGTRSYLPFLDPRREYKWLYGISPEFCSSVVECWVRSANCCKQDIDNALALSMLLIAIHPFSDGNGRIGRLLFTLLCKKWNLGSLWLNEGSDGELLRTGSGINSTEYLMANYMIKLCNGQNVIDPSTERRPDKTQQFKMYEEICKALFELKMGRNTLTSPGEFRSLKEHLISNDHFRATSPRFECLYSDIQQ